MKLILVAAAVTIAMLTGTDRCDGGCSHGCKHVLSIETAQGNTTETLCAEPCDLCVEGHVMRIQMDESCNDMVHLTVGFEVRTAEAAIAHEIGSCLLG